MLIIMTISTLIKGTYSHAKKLGPSFEMYVVTTLGDSKLEGGVNWSVSN